MDHVRPRIRSAAFLVRLYPATWRARYGPELVAILEERALTWGDAADVLRGAADAHLHPARPGRLAARAAVLAGAAWTIVVLAYLGEPVPPDWPGFLAWTLVPGLVGAVAGLVASSGFVLRLGDRPGRAVRLALIVAIACQLAWIAGLAQAAAGIGYGAVTAAAGDAAAVSLAALGLGFLRRGDGAHGLALVAIGGASLVPPPIGWLVVAATWTAIGLADSAQRARDPAPVVAS